MKETQLCSVVIPCYNHAAFLKETVASVLASEYPAIEIIIVDDGSKDNSREVAEQLVASNSNIRYIYQQNGGPSIARNNGVRNAKGVFILPLDADDLISPDYIAKAVEVLEQRPDVTVVYCEAEKFGEKTGYWKLKPFSPGLLARDNMIFVSAVYRKTDWESVDGYSEDMIWGREDWEFWIKMLKNGGKVVKLSITGFYYRIRSNSRRKKMTNKLRRVINNYLNTKHKEFIYQQLNGPLRSQRRLSKGYNTLLRTLGLLK